MPHSLQPPNLVINGILAPYLNSEQSVRLAARVVVALPPSKLPVMTDDLRLFADLMNRLSQKAVSIQYQLTCALAAWPHAESLQASSCFAVASIFPDQLEIANYQFKAVKSYDALLHMECCADLFGPAANGFVIFKVEALENHLQLGMFAVEFVSNLARPSAPCAWVVGLTNVFSNVTTTERINLAICSFCANANSRYRPF